MASLKQTQFRWYDAVTLRVVPPAVALLVKAWMGSCRVVTIEGRERAREATERAGGRGIYVTWHQRIAYLFHYLGSFHPTAMISQSRDGEYAARVAAWLGYSDVRGSSTRGGSKALRDIVARLKQGNSGGMLADGPLGPARVAKMGSIIMARYSGVPLIPLTWGGERCWVLNSWDRFLLPKPFTRVALHFAEPLWVPPDADKDALAGYRTLLEDRLNRIARRCDQSFGRERPWRKIKEPGLPETGPLPPSS